MSGDLLDVNVWVALSLTHHPFYKRSHAYWDTEAFPALYFCRTTALGLVRVCSHQATSDGLPLSPPEAWKTYMDWRNHPAVRFCDEPLGIESLLQTWVESGIVTPRTWTDAYLAAFAVRASLRLVSFDADFHRFPGLDFLHLAA